MDDIPRRVHWPLKPQPQVVEVASDIYYLYCLMFFPLFVGVLCLSLFCSALLCVRFSFAIILKRKRKQFALLLLSFWCIVTINVLWLFLKVPWVAVILTYFLTVNARAETTWFSYPAIGCSMWSKHGRECFLLAVSWFLIKYTIAVKLSIFHFIIPLRF